MEFLSTFGTQLHRIADQQSRHDLTMLINPFRIEQAMALY
jgi:hypothetical protein